MSNVSVKDALGIISLIFVLGLIGHFCFLMYVIIKNTLFYKAIIHIGPDCDEQYTIFYSIFPYSIPSKITKSYILVFIFSNMLLVPAIVLDL